LDGTDGVLDVWGLPIRECDSALLAATGFCDYYGTQ